MHIARIVMKIHTSVPQRKTLFSEKLLQLLLNAPHVVAKAMSTASSLLKLYVGQCGQARRSVSDADYEYESVQLLTRSKRLRMPGGAYDNESVV